MRPGLYEKFFGTPEERAAEDSEDKMAEALAREHIEAWIKQPHMSVFQEWLKGQRRMSDPMPGPQHDMLYQAGLRDGFRKVEDHLESLALMLQRRIRE